MKKFWNKGKEIYYVNGQPTQTYACDARVLWAYVYVLTPPVLAFVFGKVIPVLVLLSAIIFGLIYIGTLI